MRFASVGNIARGFAAVAVSAALVLPSFLAVSPAYGDDGVQTAGMAIAYQVVETPKIVDVPKATPSNGSGSVSPSKGSLPSTGDTRLPWQLYVLVGEALVCAGAYLVARGKSYEGGR